MDAQTIGGGIEGEAEAAGRRSGGTRRRRNVETAGRRDVKPRKRTVGLDAPTYRRLLHHAAELDRTPGELVAELVERHCRRFRVQDLQAGGEAEARPVVGTA
jgi:hypothetical protein